MNDKAYKKFNDFTATEGDKDEEIKEERKTNDFVLVVVFIIDFLLTYFTAMYGWNHILSVILNIKTITYGQAFGLTIIISYLTKGNYDRELGNKTMLKFIINDISYTLTSLVMMYVATWFI